MPSSRPGRSWAKRALVTRRLRVWERHFARDATSWGGSVEAPASRRSITVRTVPVAGIAVLIGTFLAGLVLATVAVAGEGGLVASWGKQPAAATPIYVGGVDGSGDLMDATAIATGINHSLALLADGSVMAWGSNEYGQIGNGGGSSGNITGLPCPCQQYPVLVSGLGGAGTLAGVTAIAAGGDHSLALLEDGSIVGWGRNDRGQLGDGTALDRSTPVHVVDTGGTQPLDHVTSIAGGTLHSVALLDDGRVMQWGNGMALPREVPGISRNGLLRAKAVAAGEFRSLALLTDGTLATFNTTGSELVPLVGGRGPFAAAVAVDVGEAENPFVHYLAVLQDGTVVAWGNNDHGQLGDGSTTNRATPVAVLDSFGSEPLQGVRAVAAGQSFSLALLQDGTIVAWGWSVQGELGDGSTTQNSDRLLPVQVSGIDGSGQLSRVRAITAGGNTSSALVAIANAPQTITFPAIDDHAYGDPPISLDASASSSLPVSYIATGTCSVDGSTLTLTGAGDCTVTASQDGNSDFAPAEDESRTFAIAQPDLDGDGIRDTLPPTTKEQCKDGGWQSFNNPSFDNQGLCQKYAKDHP